MTDERKPDWDRIVDKYSSRVFRIALRILGSVQEAEDVAQDVFVEAYRLHSAGPIHSWEGLLVRLTTLRAVDRLRRSRTSGQLGETDHLTTTGPVEEAVASGWLESEFYVWESG